MPKNKASESTNPENDPYQWVDAAVADTHQTVLTRLSLKYDGVMGKPDEWVPQNFQLEFQNARNRLLDGGYTVEQVRDLMAKEMRRSRYAYCNPKNPVSYGGFVWPPEVRSDVLTLAHLKTAVRLGPEKGLAFLTDEAHAKKVNKGERYGKHQSRNAKRPRGKIWNGGLTISQIIGRLARRQDERAKDLWGAFHGELDELGLNPQYSSMGIIEYDTEAGRKSMTLGTFEKTISQYRTGKKKLPQPG